MEPTLDYAEMQRGEDARRGKSGGWVGKAFAHCPTNVTKRPPLFLFLYRGRGRPPLRMMLG